MRALSYIIALVFVLTGPSLAGSDDRGLPGVGTFAYCESCASISSAGGATIGLSSGRWPFMGRRDN